MHKWKQAFRDVKLSIFATGDEIVCCKMNFFRIFNILEKTRAVFSSKNSFYKKKEESRNKNIVYIQIGFEQKVAVNIKRVNAIKNKLSKNICFKKNLYVFPFMDYLCKFKIPKAKLCYI